MAAGRRRGTTSRARTRTDTATAHRPKSDANTTGRITATDEWARRQDLHSLARGGLAALGDAITADRGQILKLLHRPADEALAALDGPVASLITAISLTPPDERGQRYISRLQLSNPILAAREILDICVSVLAEDRLRGNGPDAYLEAPPAASEILPIGQLGDQTDTTIEIRRDPKTGKVKTKKAMTKKPHGTDQRRAQRRQG